MMVLGGDGKGGESGSRGLEFDLVGFGERVGFMGTFSRGPNTVAVYGGLWEYGKRVGVGRRRAKYVV